MDDITGQPDLTPAGPAWQDPATRRAFSRRLGRAVLVLATGVLAAMILHATSQEQASDTDPGYAGLLYYPGLLLCFLVAMTGLAGIVTMARVARALRRPWVLVEAGLVVASTRANRYGPPELGLSDGSRRWKLIVATAPWRWRRLSEARTLLYAGDRSGVVATTDLRLMAWADSSQVPSFLMWRRFPNDRRF